MQPMMTTAHLEYGRKDQNGAIDRGDDQAELKAVMDGLAKRDAEIKSFAEKASSEIKANGAMATETKAALEKLAREGGDLQSRLMDVEQKLQRRGGSGEGPTAKSIGEQFTDSPEFKTFDVTGKGRARMKVKAVTTITSATTGTGGVGAGIRPQRLPGIITPPERPLTIRDLLMPGRTDSSSIEYVKETGFQNNAAPVAEGALKPQSDLAFSMATAPVRTIAHWFLASRQVLADIPLLQSYINTRALYGLALVEEAQLLAGDGTGQNLLGLIPQATAYNFTLYSKAGDTPLDRLRRAMTQVRVALYRASAIVVNPVDWADIETLKDGQGNYVVGDPRGAIEKRLWGLPVVDSDAIAAGKFLCGAFNMAASVIDREDAAVEASSEDSDNWRRNLVTILAEERVGLAVYRPDSFVFGNLVAGNAS